MGRILLIEADKENRSTVGFMLHMNGYQVVFCETLEEGINRYDVYRDTNRSFDLVLLVADPTFLTTLERAECDLLGQKLLVVHKNRNHDVPLSARFSGADLCDSGQILEMIMLQLNGQEGRNSSGAKQNMLQQQ